MVALIAAIAENHAIGKDNDLLWSLPDDMAFFKSTTLNQTVIMGRKNYESIPHRYRPLPNRQNIIITRSQNYEAPGCMVVNSISDGLKASAKGVPFIIGGGEIYKLALEKKLVDTMYITHVDSAFDADAFFPTFDTALWKKEILSTHDKDERHAYSFSIAKYTRLDQQ